jgi:hypothetical protein
MFYVQNVNDGFISLRMCDLFNDVDSSSKYTVLKRVAGREVPVGATAPTGVFDIIYPLYLITCYLSNENSTKQKVELFEGEEC